MKEERRSWYVRNECAAEEPAEDSEHRERNKLDERPLHAVVDVKQRRLSYRGQQELAVVSFYLVAAERIDNAQDHTGNQSAKEGTATWSSVESSNWPLPSYTCTFCLTTHF